MKNILDIQIKLRKLEESINNITKQINEINEDINDIQNEKSRKEIDFDRIVFGAKKLKFHTHPINKIDNVEAIILYIQILLSVANMNDNNIDNNELVFIQYILNSAKSDVKLSNLIVSSFQMDVHTFENIQNYFLANIKLQLALDILIIANFCGRANSQTYDFVAELFGLLQIDKKQTENLAVLAKYFLTLDASNLKTDNPNELIQLSKKFTHYFSKKLMQNNYKDFRIIVLEISAEKCLNFKWEVMQQSLIKKGDIIATYKASSLRRGSENKEKIISDADGTIFEMQINKVKYGVVSAENDNIDSIKSWIKSIRR